MHRLATLALCVALLFAGMPAFACAGMSGDCCDPSELLPCHKTPLDSQGSDEVACCASASTAQTSRISSKEERRWAVDALSMDAPIAPVASIEFKPKRNSDFLRPHAVDSPHSFGTSTYLITGRLRL
jgi:hypothetical protein